MPPQPALSPTAITLPSPHCSRFAWISRCGRPLICPMERQDGRGGLQVVVAAVPATLPATLHPPSHSCLPVPTCPPLPLFLHAEGVHAAVGPREERGAAPHRAMVGAAQRLAPRAWVYCPCRRRGVHPAAACTHPSLHRRCLQDPGFALQRPRLHLELCGAGAAAGGGCCAAALALLFGAHGRRSAALARRRPLPRSGSPSAEHRRSPSPPSSPALSFPLSPALCAQSLVKSFEATDLPVRTARFVPRKQWVVCGADDMFVRVYNYNTMDKVKQFEAHTDYIRCANEPGGGGSGARSRLRQHSLVARSATPCPALLCRCDARCPTRSPALLRACVFPLPCSHIAVHPTLPYILTCSDDMLIKLWDWDKGWACTQIFEGHSHYVMQASRLGWWRCLGGGGCSSDARRAAAAASLRQQQACCGPSVAGWLGLKACTAPIAAAPPCLCSTVFSPCCLPPSCSLCSTDHLFPRAGLCLPPLCSLCSTLRTPTPLPPPHWIAPSRCTTWLTSRGQKGKWRALRCRRQPQGVQGDADRQPPLLSRCLPGRPAVRQRSPSILRSELLAGLVSGQPHRQHDAGGA